MGRSTGKLSCFIIPDIDVFDKKHQPHFIFFTRLDTQIPNNILLHLFLLLFHCGVLFSVAKSPFLAVLWLLNDKKCQLNHFFYET